MNVFLLCQGKAATVDSVVGTVDSGTGFTILSEKKLFLGQKVTQIPEIYLNGAFLWDQSVRRKPSCETMGSWNQTWSKHHFDCLLQLTVLQGDLVKVTADAIVHPTNSTFYMGGEVGKFYLLSSPAVCVLSWFCHCSLPLVLFKRFCNKESGRKRLRNWSSKPGTVSRQPGNSWRQVMFCVLVSVSKRFKPSCKTNQTSENNLIDYSGYLHC